MPRLKSSLALVWLCVALLSSSVSYATTIPSFSQIKAQHTSSDQLLLDKSGVLLQQHRVNFRQRQGGWLSLEAMSPALIRLLLQAEDRRFYEHSGVDWYAVAGTAWGSLWGQHLRGTSTISMQLVDLLGLGSGRVAGQRSVVAKWEQARFAQQVEREWTKAQILEAYLNLVPFRGEIVGVDAMARVLWQKQAFALSLPEAALAVAMLPSPNTSIEQLQQRSCLRWRALRPDADCAAQRWHNARALKRLAQPAWGNPNAAPHVAAWLSRQTGSAVFQSSIEQPIQQQAQQIMQRHLVDLKGVNANDAAVVVLHNATGQVVAYVGSSQQSEAAQLDHVQAKRQAGSTLKPFLYQLALAERRITAASLLADSAVQFSTPYGVYVPQNYDEQFMGWVSARVALAGSINIPAVRLLAQVGVDRFQEHLHALGFDLPYSADYYGLGLALGGVDVSLWQLVTAYRSLANLGLLSPSCFRVGCENTLHRVAPAAASWLVQDMLADNTARAVTFGLDSVLNTPFWTAVKTGTSKDMRDNWTIGFSQYYTVGVWVGNTDGSAMHEVSGVSGAGPIWHDLMVVLHTAQPSRVTAPPATVVCQNVIFVNHTERARTECFLVGTERTEVRLQPPLLLKEYIVAPMENTTYALDPDIPLSQQQLRVEAQVSPDRQVIWHINGSAISTQLRFFWQPLAGRHQIELFDAQTKENIDTVYIQVKG